jgi:hypothetical protein
MRSQIQTQHDHLKKFLDRRRINDAEKWLQAKKQAALDIDSETAKVFWDYRYMHDPYGIVAAPAQEYDEQYGWVMREYFARSKSGIWVWFGDLPKRTANTLTKTHWNTFEIPDGFFEGHP